MVQRRKSEVEARIREAAERCFARDGVPTTTMAGIAREAGVSAGNLYRYFPSKDALFDAIMDLEFVARFDTLLQARVAALLRVDAEARQGLADPAARELLAFWTANRRRVVILLHRNEGTPFEAWGERFVESLVELSAAHLEGRTGGPLPELVPFTLRSIFHTSRRAIVAILESYEDPAQIAEAFEAFWSFQLAGLAGFERWVSNER